jgi:CRISPR associated protein Cas1
MLGIMHADRDDAAAFVLDMMEPERPEVDRAVLAFLKSDALHPGDFTLREDGSIRSWQHGDAVDGALGNTRRDGSPQSWRRTPSRNSSFGRTRPVLTYLTGRSIRDRAPLINRN